MAIKDTMRGGGDAGRGDNPHTLGKKDSRSTSMPATSNKSTTKASGY